MDDSTGPREGGGGGAVMGCCSSSSSGTFEKSRYWYMEAPLLASGMAVPSSSVMIAGRVVIFSILFAFVGSSFESTLFVEVSFLALVSFSTLTILLAASFASTSAAGDVGAGGVDASAMVNKAK